MPAFTQPTFPQTLTSSSTPVVFKTEPMDKAVLISAVDPLNCTLFIETSRDNGVDDEWSPAAAVKEATMRLDGTESGGISPTDGVNSRWRVSTFTPGGYVRLRVTAGSIVVNEMRPDAFFFG